MGRSAQHGDDGTTASADGDLPTPTSGSATDRVYQAIMAGIRAGSFVPGQHLFEIELAETLGVGRSSLREGLKQLAAEGIVTHSRFRGSHISILTRDAVLELLDVLKPLSQLAARRAAERCTTEAARRRIEAAMASFKHASSANSSINYLEQRRHFYDVMVEIGGNRELIRAMPLARADLCRAQIEAIQSTDEKNRRLAGYSRISAAILANDPVEASEAVDHQYERTRQAMLALPDSAFPKEKKR